MSGGSYNYAYCKVQDMADSLINQKEPFRQAFGKHLQEVAKAMKAVEWVDSCDCSYPHDLEAIEKVLTDIEHREARILIDDCVDLLKAMSKIEDKLSLKSENLRKFIEPFGDK